MIRKPPETLRRESVVVTHLRSAATGSVATVRVAQYYVRGMLCWSFAALWGFAALAGGLFLHSVATFAGVGAMAAFMAWSGVRLFRQARR